MKNSFYGYDNVFYSGHTFTAEEFSKQFDQLTVHGVTHLTSEVIKYGEESYKHPLKGALHTSMGDIEVFNYSDKN